jgi:hypothetical protein
LARRWRGVWQNALKSMAFTLHELTAYSKSLCRPAVGGLLMEWLGI